MVIYKTTNLINSKFYIGQDSKNDPEYLGSGILIKKAIEKYGIENFKKEIIEECSTKHELDQAEIKWILLTKATVEGYNIATGGQGGNLGPDVAKKKSESMKRYIKENKPDYMKGRNNARYDKTIHKFFNLETNEVFEGTKYDMALHIGSITTHVTQVVNGKRNHHKKWVLYSNKDKYTEKYLQKLRSKNAKAARQKVKNIAKPHLGKSWYHNPDTNHKVLSYEKPEGYIKGRGKS